MVYGWHFTRADKRLGYEDGRKFVKGRKLTVDGPLELCARGLHASPRALDALNYAPGPVACYVQLSGEVLGPTDRHKDKMCATERTVIAYVDATPHLREFIRDTLIYRQPHIATLLWNDGLRKQAQEVRQADLKEMSFEDIKKVFGAARAAARAAAWDAAWAAARDAARAAARDAAWAAAWDAARDAAWDAARDAAWAAARDAAWDAAWAAARDAARDNLNAMLERRLMDAMNLSPEHDGGK